MKHPQKIRTRTDQEIGVVVAAYKDIYARDPFRANMFLLISELSEYIPIPIEVWTAKDEEKLTAFIKGNMDGLIFQFVRRFKSINQYALPRDPLASHIFMAGGNGLIN